MINNTSFSNFNAQFKASKNDAKQKPDEKQTSFKQDVFLNKMSNLGLSDETGQQILHSLDIYG